MPFIIMLIFLVVWCFIFWIGSLLLEKTGLDRSKARFQTLSALTGTGFTTAESEDIVNHTKRRRITTWLIFIGNTGILAFIITAILFVRAGLTAPSLLQILIVIGVLILLVLSIIFKLVDRLTNFVLRITANDGDTVRVRKTLYQTEKYEIFSLIYDKSSSVGEISSEKLQSAEEDFSLLAIDKGTELITSPDAETLVKIGEVIIGFRKL